MYWQFFEKSNGFPSRDGLAEILTNHFKVANVKNFDDRHSLFGVSQSFVDSVIGTKQSLYKKLQGVYEYKKAATTILTHLYSQILWLPLSAPAMILLLKKIKM